MASCTQEKVHLEWVGTVEKGSPFIEQEAFEKFGPIRPNILSS